MAAVFLVTMFEYSPVFYITVVSLCFLVTAAMVLGWCGFDVPVMLRSSDEVESLLPTPEKQMVQTTNPFTLELGPGPASVSDGVFLRPGCLEPCVLSCFWGCEVGALQVALQAHQQQHRPRLSTPLRLQEALQLRYLHCHSVHVASDDTQEHHTHIPADQGITDFGPLPRQRYPLVAVLTLAEPEARNVYNIVASLTVIHVPDDRHRLSARVLFQYLLTSTGNMFQLKPLFMSADGLSEPPAVEQRTRSTEASPAEEGAGPRLGGRGRDCVVCQNAAVNKVLLPCRHACVCDSCVGRFQHCPMCRAFVHESFTLTRGPEPGVLHPDPESRTRSPSP
ncbi:cell growth regulator with RING finger domain protein 1 [Pseudoliparis swirei]|uniref:cell growth regulator with RING finger domain protein 1 n=1 Tax=Pseudoliparis swirei TaxID=2059687 RepID=UPI0024BE2EE1|nr:cell growth regulator with RING finger domain protein 1 [Pseudoliparis swirei]